MKCAVYSVQCIVCIIQCAVCSVQCAVCIIQGAVCSVQCALSSVYQYLLQNWSPEIYNDLEDIEGRLDYLIKKHPDLLTRWLETILSHSNHLPSTHFLPTYLTHLTLLLIPLLLLLVIHLLHVFVPGRSWGQHLRVGTFLL